MRFQQLEPVADRVGGEDAVVAGQGLVVDDVDSGLPEAQDEAPEVPDEQGGMRLPRRNSDSTPRWTFTAPFSNQAPPRLASSGGFAISGMSRSRA
jgi:hypothetical protein